MSYKSFGDRLNYLSLKHSAHTSPRHLSNEFYKSHAWLTVRDEIIIRDLGCDLGDKTKTIEGIVLVHHINPLTEEDIVNQTWKLFDPENLITCSLDTHNRIHYKEPIADYVERQPGDTKLW